MDDEPSSRTSARALYPNRPEVWASSFLYESTALPLPIDHPELPFELEITGRTLDPETSTFDEFDTAAVLKTAAPPSRLDEPMPSRMLNEFVYCPRLFYYGFVEGVFVENADTERGSALHTKVDKGRGDLPAVKKSKRKKDLEETDPAFVLDAEGSASSTIASEDETSSALVETSSIEPAQTSAKGQKSDALKDTIHSRSAMLSSERLGVVAKMDLIEVRMGYEDGLFGGRVPLSVTPVDYKAGAPREGVEKNELWDTDKMQLGLQILILRDNGYVCDDGVIYYRATKQRVRLAMTSELETWITGEISKARETALGPMPPPLIGSPKCVRCSLAPVCLPDETWMLARARTQKSESPAWQAPRRLMAARDESRALYLNTPGLRVGQKDEILVVKEDTRVLQEVRLADLSHVALFGNIQITTQAIQLLCEKEIPLAYFSMGGWFYGLTRGHGMKNVFTRIEQFRTADDRGRCLALARKFVHGKIRNQRTLLMRLHVEAPAAVLLRLKQASLDVLTARSVEQLLGMEGAAAALYFQHFSGMIKATQPDGDELPGLEDTERPVEPSIFTFDFKRRTRRPPTDPVNALLSLSYSLLSKDCTIAAHAVGFDPYVGFYHQPRFGRPALALDLMEEFRPLIAESTVLTAINNRMITANHFVRAGDAVNLSPAGRKVFFQAYEQRMNTLITHPVFDYKVSYRRVLELQARLLAGHLTGEIPEYLPMMTR